MREVTPDMIDAGRNALYEDAVFGPRRGIDCTEMLEHDSFGLTGTATIDFEEVARLILDAAKQWCDEYDDDDDE